MPCSEIWPDRLIERSPGKDASLSPLSRYVGAGLTMIDRHSRGLRLFTLPRVLTRAMMRSLMALMGALAVSVTCIASAVALASAAKPGTYAGTGKDYMNNVRNWAAEATSQFSFQVPAGGREITNFRGAFLCYCGGGSSFLTAKSIPSQPVRLVLVPVQRCEPGERQVVRPNYVWIAGSLAGSSSASISYLFDSVGTGNRVPNPYDTAHPHQLGCASWVKGTAHAR